MNRFLHTNMKSILIGIMVSMASFLSPTVATGQTGFWTDEGNYDPDWPSADDIDGNYYNIRNEEDLAAFARLVNTGEETFKGKIVRVYNTHIDLKEHYWIPIGWYEKGHGERKFEGTFDGMKHRFENVCIDIDQMLTANMDVEKIGFFGNNYGTIKNVSLQSMQIRGTEYNSYLRIGGCAVYNKEGAVIENCIIFDDPVKVTEQASLVDIAEIDCNIGGICYENYGTIRKCRNEKPIEISRGDIGGIVNNNYGTLIECENSRSLRSPVIVSGIAVFNYGNGCISECTNSGDLYGGDYYYGSFNLYGAGAFGIVYSNGDDPDLYLSRVENCINTGKIEGGVAAGICMSNDVYSGGSQMRNNQNAGHIIGKKAAGIVVKNGNVLDGCINTGQVDGFYSAAGITCSSPTYVYSISNCENKGKIIAMNDGSGSVNQNAYAGGICADGLSINNCRNMGEVYASAPVYAYAGGILAYFSFTEMEIAYCYNTASVSAVLEKGRSTRAYSGGIVGESDSSNSHIYNCFNSGKISCENKTSESDVLLGAGGILGHLSGSNKVTVSNSYNTGEILTQGARSYAYAIGGWEINACFNIGSVNAYGLSNAQDASTTAYGIGSNPTRCLSLGKNISSTKYAYKVGGNKVEQGNYASSLLKIEDKDGDCSAREGLYENGDHGKFWYLDTAAPLDAWSDKAWDKSDNTILPQLKYADGTLMPNQPRLLKSDYATETPSEPEQPASPSDATLKSLSYKIGDNGQVTPVPNFSPDVYLYEIGYRSNEEAMAEGQVPLYPDGTRVYPSGVSTNEKAKVLPSDMLLPYGFAKVGVASEDKSTERTYSLFMMSEKDAGSKYYVMMNLEHMTVQINGTTYKNGDIYKADHNENVTVKLIPDQGYKLPSSIQIDEGSSISFLELGQTSEINLREINWHMSLSASAVENTGQEDNSIFVYDNLKYRITGNNTVSVVGPDTQDNATWPITSCSIPATIIHDGKTYNVTIIEEDAFNGCTKLAGITLPEGIKSIRANAFNMCQALTSIIIPASVDSIGDYAFDNDENLAKVTLKEGLKVIGQGTFEDCAITSLEIPSTVVEMDEGDLFDTMLATINVHTNNTVYASIDGILYNKAKTSLLFCPPMYPVKKCTIPDKVTSIRNEAFQNCEKIEEIILPEGIETIGTDAFCSCIALKSITIPSTIKTLGGYLFEGDGDYAVHLDEIHCNHQNPADITIDTSADTFYGIDFNTCKLYVPKGTKTKYQTAESWKRFKNIIEEGDNLPLIPDKIDDEITLNTDSTYTDGEGNTGHFNGMIGNGEEETAINKLTIKGSATSTTTTITFNHVTVGNGSSTSETTTSVTKNTNVVIELIGDNSLGKLVNDGIAKLISKVEAALKNTVVINNGIFVDETGLLTRVEGTAELDITAPSDQEVRPGENVTLTTSTKISVTYAVTFIWEQLQPDGTWKAVGSPNVYTPARSGLRSTATVTDRLTIQAKDAGKYRCVIRNKVGDVSSTLTTPPATVTAKSTVDIITPKSYRKVTPCGNQLHFEISTPTEVKIINLNGALIRSVSLPAGDTYIDGLDKGVYILLFEDGVTQKVRI